MKDSGAPQAQLEVQNSVDLAAVDEELSIHPSRSYSRGKANGMQPQEAGEAAEEREQKGKDGQSIHGDSAARRRAITELLFFASVGDSRRCQRIVRLWNLEISDPTCCDYDKRTPLHLAASEGCYQVTEWLITTGCNINALDRFNRTPLEDAVRGEYREVAKLLIDHGGRVFEDGQLVDLASSRLAGGFGYVPVSLFNFDPDWEIDPASLHIGEKLGEGEFGVVHKAKWYGTTVAAKILKGSSDIALGDFRGEIEILRRVHHPNAVQFLGACTKKEPYILVTELMTGGSLADAFRRPQVFPMRRAVEIALDAARGLAYLHNRKPNPIIHRDLKPGNLMLSGNPYQDQTAVVFDTGVVKLADFGLSKTLPINKHAEIGYLDSKFRLTGETGETDAVAAHAVAQRAQQAQPEGAAGSAAAEAGAQATEAGAVPVAAAAAPGSCSGEGGAAHLAIGHGVAQGSYRYMAPEVFRHEPYNSRVDVYSYSMIVYQLFEYQPPFSGIDPVEAARQAALYERRPDFVSLLQPHPQKKELRELISRCWSPDPEDRPSFPQIVDDLEAILAKLPRPQLTQGADGGCCTIT